MSLARHYLDIEEAEDAKAALSHVFMANGDAVFTAEKRTAECFFTRGRGRSLNTDLLSYATDNDADDGEDLHVETKYLENITNLVNQYLSARIKTIEEEFANYGKVTKNIQGLLLDLKTTYCLLLSKSDLEGLSMLVLPGIETPLWKELWDVSNLEVKPLENFTLSEIEPEVKDEPLLATLIRRKVKRDRYVVLDNMITYFKKIKRTDIVEAIKVNEFHFINDTSTSIANKYKIEDEGFRVINEARLQYISKVKIDLQYSQELIGVNATTYKRRSGPIKVELTQIGEEFSKTNTNEIQEYILG